jgi:hypothetical protein
VNKGFVFSLEGIIALFLLLIVIISFGHVEKKSLIELFTIQKEHDLLKIWAKQGIPTEKEIIEDFTFVFPGKNGRVVIEEKEIILGEVGKSGISVSTVILDDELKEEKISLIVFD